MSYDVTDNCVARPVAPSKPGDAVRLDELLDDPAVAEFLVLLMGLSADERAAAVSSGSAVARAFAKRTESK